MSTFTDWNGPQGSDVRASDLIELATAYRAVLAKLESHINSTGTSVPSPHGIKELTTKEIEELKSSLDSVYAKASELATLATKDDLTEYAKTADLSAYAKASELATLATKDDLTDKVTTSGTEKDLDKILKDYATKANDLKNMVTTSGTEKDLDNIIENYLKKEDTDDIVMKYKKYSAVVGGMDNDGPYYILGMLDVDKKEDGIDVSLGSGTAFIKMYNTKPFAAKVDFAVKINHADHSGADNLDPDRRGDLIITTNCIHNDLSFKIVVGTDSEGSAHTYLAIQSSEWQTTRVQDNATALFASIEFEAAGINFLPVAADRYRRPNQMTHIIYSYNFVKTDVDLPVGAITLWHKYEEVVDTETQEVIKTVAIDVPHGFHACDGEDVTMTDFNNDAAAFNLFVSVVGPQYPLVDYSMIKIIQ